MKKAIMPTLPKRTDICDFTRNGLPIRKYLLPNVEWFKVIGGDWDDRAKVLDLYRKVNRTYLAAKLDKDDSMNRYLIRIFDKLYGLALKGERDRFARNAKFLFERSNTVKMVFLNRTFPGWYKEMEIKEIVAIFSEVRKISQNEYEGLDVKRVMIPKPDGTSRPLSVPTKGWRLYSNWQLFLLWMWNRAQNNIPDNQHGSIPGRGTKTAWEHIIEKVLDAPDIFEFDLKKFFDRVYWNKIAMTMRALNHSDLLIDPLMYALLECDLLRNRTSKERVLVFAPTLYGLYRSWMNYSIAGWREKWKWFKYEMEKKSWNIRMAESYTQVPRSKIDFMINGKPDPNFVAKWGSGDSLTTRMVNTEYLRWEFGIPQGLATSPFVACMTLWNLCKAWKNKLIMYMDDGLLYGEISDKLLFNFKLSCILEGTEVSDEKSGWIKRNGKWLKPLKFLGIEYDPRTETIRGATRNGSNFEVKVNQEELKEVLAKARSSYQESKEFFFDVEKMPLPKTFVKHDMLGFVMAVMYNNGKLVHKESNEKVKRNSVLGLLRKQTNTFNASSIALANMGPIFKIINSTANNRRKTRDISKLCW